MNEIVGHERVKAGEGVQDKENVKKMYVDDEKILKL